MAVRGITIIGLLLLCDDARNTNQHLSAVPGNLVDSPSHDFLVATAPLRRG